MIIRATQKKMMSKPVTSTDDGRNVRSSRVSSGQPSVEWHQSADENHVSSTSSSCANDAGLAAELGHGLRARAASVARDVDAACFVVPRRDAVPPPQLPRDAPVLDVVDPVEVRRQPLVGHELHARAFARSPIPAMPSPTAARHEVLDRACRENTDASPAPASSSRRTIGPSASARRSSPVRPQRGTTIRCAFSLTTRPERREIRQHRLARGVAVEAAVFFRRVGVDRRVEIQDWDRRQIVALPDLPVVEVVRGRDLDAAGAEVLSTYASAMTGIVRPVSGSATVLPDEPA